MTLLDRLAHWHSQSKITPEQYAILAAMERRERFSVFFELNALLYLGVMAFVGGLGWTIHSHFARIGDTLVIVGLMGLCLACLGYCAHKAPPFSTQEMESPNFVFDYVLYLGALAFSVLLGYLEYRFQLLGAQWDFYLLVAAIFLFVLAYRFDNRLVLSLALSTLATWFGVKISAANLVRIDTLRPYAVAYAGSTAAVGAALARLKVKAHFEETYFQIAAHVFFIAVCSGIFARATPGLWVSLLFLGAALCAWFGKTTHRFSFIVYSVLYGYIGGSSWFLHQVGLHWSQWSYQLLYYLTSGTLVIGVLVGLSRKFSKDT